MDDWFMLMLDSEYTPSEISEMTYPEMLLVVLHKLDPQRRQKEAPQEGVISSDDYEDDADYTRALANMTGKRLTPSGG